MQTDIYQLFVYGSLRKGFHHPAYQYISKYFTLIGDAKVKGVLYDLGDYPAAVPVFTDNFIVGELYTLKNTDEFSWAIAQLDDYEGVHAELGELPLYRREVVTVFCNGLSSFAWIYWYKGDISGHTIIKSGDVLQYLHEKNKK